MTVQQHRQKKIGWETAEVMIRNISNGGVTVNDEAVWRRMMESAYQLFDWENWKWKMTDEIKNFKKISQPTPNPAPMQITPQTINVPQASNTVPQQMIIAPQQGPPGAGTVRNAIDLEKALPPLATRPELLKLESIPCFLTQQK